MNLKIILSFLTFMLIISMHAQNTSELWGESGELWSPESRLPDFSFAGYHSGKEQIPDNIPIVVNVKDFGAKGDGETNDLQSFKDAIEAANNGAVLIPKGKYIIDGLLNVTQSNIVLRGEGDSIGGTELHFTKNLTKILGGKNNEPWRYGVGGLLWVGKRGSTEVGPFLSMVTESSARGSNKITLNNTSAIKAGDYIVLKMTEPTDRSLTFYLHNNQVTNEDYGVFSASKIRPR